MQKRSQATAKKKRKTPSGRILEDTFWSKFKPIKNTIAAADRGWDGCLFETYGEELKRVEQAPRSRVWTWVDSDTGERSLVVAGMHMVNRIAYFITEEDHSGVEFFRI